MSENLKVWPSDLDETLVELFGKVPPTLNRKKHCYTSAADEISTKCSVGCMMPHHILKFKSTKTVLFNKLLHSAANIAPNSQDETDNHLFL